MELLTHKDLADLLGVSVTTVKSYRRKFPGAILVANQGKPIRFKPEAAQVATRIRDLFETGMAVPEVRLRLALEFPWIAPESPREETSGAVNEERNSQDAASLDSAGDLANSVSSLAKSMVAMSQQQKGILRRMGGIEAMLEELGLKGAPDAEVLRQGNRQRQDKESLIEERLSQLDAVTQGLAETMVQLSVRLERFLGKRATAAKQWREDGGLASVMPEVTEARIATAEPISKVIPLHPPQAAACAPVLQTVEEAPARSGQEPPRSFLTAPLIVRTGQGQTVSAGGRGRGRFSLNDVKAMLIYGFSPPNNYTLTWEPHGEGWWLTLSQAPGAQASASHLSVPQTSGTETRDLRLLLMELPSQSGGTVVEIMQLKDNERSMHPMEFCAIVDSWNAV